MGLTIEQAKDIMRATTLNIFNTSDPTSRRKLMETHWSPNVICYTPQGTQAQGYDALDAVWDGVHGEGRDKWQFETVGDIWVNGNLVQQEWVFGRGEEGEWRGWDVIIVGEDGKVDVFYALVGGANSFSL